MDSDNAAVHHPHYSTFTWMKYNRHSITQ